MAEERGIVFGRKAYHQIAEVVRRVLRDTRNESTSQSRGRSQQRMLTCVVDTALAAPANGLTSATTATASVLKRNSSGNLVDTTENITIVNRAEGVSIAQYTLCMVAWMDGEWRVIAADCNALGDWP